MIPTKSLLLQTIILFQRLIQKAEANLDTNSCDNLILQKNELYCEFRDINYFFIGQNSDNLTNTDTFQIPQDLIKVSSGPLLFSKDDIVISMKFRELIDENEICSLIFNTLINTYSLNCILTQPTFIIDNKFQLLINTQFNLEIQTQQSFNCSQFNYNTEGIILFCYSIHQIKLYQLSIEQNNLNQTVIFQSENHNLQCLLKFHSYSNSFLIIYFQCLEWKIQIYQNNTFKLEIDQNYLKEKYNIEGNLLDVITCQSIIVILLSSGGYIFNNENLNQLFITEDLKLNETLITFDQNCQISFAVKTQTNTHFLSSFQKKYLDIIFNTKDFPKEIFQIQFPQSLFIKYEDYFTFYVNEFLHQTIKIKIQNLFQLSNSRMYLGIGEGNQITLILIRYTKQCLPSYDINDEYSKYYIIQELKKDSTFILSNYWNCYKLIIIDNDEQKKEYAIRINLENKNYIIERTDYEDKFQINIIRSAFSSIQPHRIAFPSSLNQINFQLKINQVKCQFNHYLKNYKGKFFIKTKNDYIYSIIVQGSGNNIVEYNCDNQNNHMYENLLPLNEQTILKLGYSNTLLLLDQQKRCLYKVILQDEYLQQMPIKIICLESQIEKIFNINYQITIKLKDQFVIYNLKQTQAQLILEQSHLPKQITLNCLEIFQLFSNFYVVVYTNELQLIYKEVTVQIININAKVLGCMAKSQSTLLMHLIVLDLIKNELQFYIVSITEFQLIRNYNLENYIPIQPLQFKVQEQLIIISCQHKINKKLFILIFKCESQISFHSLQQVIETNSQFFFVQKHFLYYFNDKNQLSIQDLLHITIVIENLEFKNESSQEVILQLQVELEDSEIPPMKQDIMIKLINPSILKLIQNNSNLLIKHENQEMNFRNYILGKIDNIYLNPNDNFKLQYPLENQFIMQCSYYCNKFCFQLTNSESGIFFKVGQSNETYMIYDLQHYIQNMLFIEVIKDNQFIFINSINNKTLQISLMILKDQIFKLQKQIDTYFNNDVEEIVLVQNILLIQYTQIQNRFLIDENDISQVDFPILSQQSLIYNISSETFLEVFVHNIKQMIIIKLFKIINYKVEIQSVFEISIMNYQLKEQLYGYMSLIQSNFMKLIKQNFSQVNQQIDLSLYLISKQKFSVQFQIRLYLKEKRYELINNKILRNPENVQLCKYIVITEEEIIFQCGITRYYYDMKNSDYLFDPIHSTKNLLNMELLNSTHYLFYKHFEHNQSIVLYAGQRGGYVLQKLSQDITYPIFLEFYVISIDQTKIDQVTLNIQVNQQDIIQNQFSQLSLIIFIMVLIIVLATIIFYYRKHQIQNQEFSKVITQEISLSTISLKNPSQI